MDWEANFCLYQLWKLQVILSIHFPVKIVQVCDLNFLIVLYAQTLLLVFSTCPCERWVYQQVHYGCLLFSLSLSSSLPLSPSLLPSLLEVTASYMYIKITLLSTFKHVHSPENCRTTLGEISSHWWGSWWRNSFSTRFLLPPLHPTCYSTFIPE